MSYKIGEIVDLESAEVEIKRGERVLCYLTLAGPEHPKRRAIAHARIKRMQSMLQRSGGNLMFPDPAESEADELEEMIASVLGWRDVLDEKGAALPCTPENVRRFIAHDQHAWIRRQIKAALDDRERFIKDSAPPS